MGVIAKRQRLESEGPRSKNVVRLPFLESDGAIVAAIRAGQSEGGAALYDRYHAYVRRVFVRVLGPDSELHDLVQDVFLIAIDSLDRLEEPEALRGWLAGIAVHRARGEIRRRTRSRWFAVLSRDALPEVAAPISTPEIDEAVRAAYRVLDKLSADERIAFALRFIDGMELSEVAEACQVSLSTIKRCLSRAQSKFVTIARTYPELVEWLERSARWS